MQSLVEALKDTELKRRIVTDGVTFIDNEVRAKKGVSGLALKAAYKTVKALKPGMIAEALGHLLPDFAPAVDPHYAQARESGDVPGYFSRNADDIAESLLAVTDERAQRSTNRVMKKAYSGVRGQAKKHTSAAMPGLAGLLSRHLD